MFCLGFCCSNFFVLGILLVLMLFGCCYKFVYPFILIKSLDRKFILLEVNYFDLEIARCFIEKVNEYKESVVNR